MPDDEEDTPLPRLDFDDDDFWTQERLGAFWVKYHRSSKKNAEQLLGAWRPQYMKIAEKLAHYASSLSVSITCREKKTMAAYGKACEANYQHACDRIFEELPHDIQERMVVPLLEKIKRSPTLSVAFDARMENQPRWAFRLGGARKRLVDVAARRVEVMSR